jgi:hypothetical protein
MGFLIGFPLFIVSPCLLSAWIGTRVRSPVIAFLLTWLLTPFTTALIAILGTPVLRAITPPENDGTGVIMLPFFGIVTGLIAGIVAAILVSKRSTTSQTVESTTES